MADQSVDMSSEQIQVFSQESTASLTAKELLITEKGKLKWRGDYGSLKSFLEDVLSIKGKWSSPGGGAKALNCEEVTIRWYCDNNTLTINGPEMERVKRSLDSLAIPIASSDIADENKSSLQDTEAERGEERQTIIPTMRNTNELEHSLEDKVCSVNEVSCIKEHLFKLKSEFEGFQFETGKLIQSLLEKSMKDTNDDDIEKEISNLRLDNSHLKEENRLLVKRIDNLDNILIDQQNKIKIAEERQTMTAMKNTDEVSHSLENEVSSTKEHLFKLKSEFEGYQLETDKLIQGLLEKSSKDTSECMETVMTGLRQENSQLKKENQSLVNRMDNLGYILADLQNKIKIAEEEKASLMTAIRLIQSDADANCPTQRSFEPEQIVKHRKTNKKNNTCQHINNDQEIDPSRFAKQNGKPVRDVLGTNKFSVLEIEESNDEEASVASNSIFSNEENEKSKREQQRTTKKDGGFSSHYGHTQSKQQRNPTSSRQERSAPASRGKQRSVVICGDSTTKYLQAHKIGRSSNERVKSITISGATCKDMKHYIVPTVDKKPDEIILHVGTNDLKDNQTTKIVQDIVALRNFATENSPNTKVTLSQLLCRSDDTGLNNKVKNINLLLNEKCQQNNWSIITHEDIDQSCLNQSGVHLNQKGTSLFASSIIKHLRHV